MWGLVDDERPRGSLAFPRSYCPHCRTPISAWRLIPIASYLVQRGRCAECNGQISPRYLLVEIGGAAAAALAFGLFGLTFTALAVAMFGWVLLALAAIDWETGYLPDMLTIPLLALGIIINVNALLVPIEASLIGAAAGYASFRLIGAAFHALRGHEGLGQGDAKLVAAIGAWGGWQILPLAIFAAASVTLLAVITMRAFGKIIGSETPIPFGPGLCLGGYIAVIGSFFLA